MVSSLSMGSKVKLNNGTNIPFLGLGTYRLLSGTETENAVTWALDYGYRHIDTAALYGNEESVGRAIRKSDVPREDIFVTTKLLNNEHDDAAGAFENSLKKLGMDYVDLYLIHWPVENKWKTSWKIIEKLYNEKKCRAIGVSNFTISHLKQLLEFADITPAINQVEFSPYLYQKELLEFCKSKNIVLEAYSPLTRGVKFSDERLVSMATKYKKTPAQLMLRWVIQHGLPVMPKSKSKERIKENADIFDFSISQSDMEHLDSFNENLHISWDPTNAP